MHANILTTAQKHKMLLEYNQEREQKYAFNSLTLILIFRWEAYQENKNM